LSFEAQDEKMGSYVHTTAEKEKIEENIKKLFVTTCLV
jgi:hypothetical protein